MYNASPPGGATCGSLIDGAQTYAVGSGAFSLAIDEIKLFVRILGEDKVVVVEKVVVFLVQSR